MIKNFFPSSKTNKEESNPLLPTLPMRALIIGPSSCGKTNLLINLLIGENKFNYDKLYIISSTLHQYSYQSLMKYCDKHKIDASFFDSVDEFDIQELDIDKKNVVVIDDMISNNNDPLFKELFCRGRHYNASPIFLSQSYFITPKLIRDNASWIVLFKMNQREISTLCSRVGDMTIPMLQSIIKNLPKYGFTSIDHNSPDSDKKYRIGLDKYIVI